MKRRHFLTALASTAISTRFLQASPNQQANQMRLGFSTYGMKNLPAARAIEVISSIGYKSIEFALMPGWPMEPSQLADSSKRDLAAQIKASKLSVDAFMLNIRPTGPSKAIESALGELDRAVQLSHDLLPNQSVPPIETVLGGRPHQWETMKESMAKGVKRWARWAEQAEATIAIKPHVGGAMCTPERAEWLRQQVDSPSIKLAYDYSHFGLQDIPLESSLETMMPHTVFVHIKDFIRLPNKGFRFVLPGHTEFPYDRYFQLLKGHRYSGSVCVEVSGQVFGQPGYDPIQAAKDCYAKLTPAFRNA